VSDYIVWNVQRGLTVADGLTYAAACALQEQLERDEGTSFIVWRKVS
jgi:hypothetical protein